MPACTTLPAVVKLLHDYDDVPVECDGHTLIVSRLLDELFIPHSRFYGVVTVSTTGQQIAPHCWIECRGMLLDYRLRMWVDLPDSADSDFVPHGCFTLEQAKKGGFLYSLGEVFPAKPVNDFILSVMTDGVWNKLKIGASQIGK